MEKIGAAFINRDGFVTIKPNAENIPGDGNGWLQTGLAVACGAYPLNSTQLWIMLGRCRKSATCPLIWRSPYKRNPDDDQKCDDYWGALPLNELWAKEVLGWGEAYGWVFDTREIGGLEYRFDRFWGFVPFLRLCAGRRISLWESVELAGSILLDAFSIANADGNMKAYCKLRVAEESSALSAAAAKIWRSRIKKRYGRIGASWAKYFGEGHPLNEFDE